MNKQKDEQYWAQQALSLMDLTSLNDDDTKSRIRDLCSDANTQFGTTAAVCVYPAFIRAARKALDASGVPQVKVATVTNFPHGNDDVKAAKKETKKAAKKGADEIDVVFPYRALIEGNEKVGAKLVKKCKKVCKKYGVVLKVIIESGELQSPALIKKASEIAIENGADFIKTSTGKVSVNATLEAATIMLNAIKDSGKNIGFKAAGGVRTVQDAQEYLALAQSIMGEEWVCADTFRFGASGLLDNVIAVLSGSGSAQSTSGY